MEERSGGPGGLEDAGTLVFPGAVEGLLARCQRLGDEPLDVLRDLRGDLTTVLGALRAAQEILASDVAVLRQCLSRARAAADAPGGGPQRAADPLEGLPRALAQRPWGRGWSAPPPGDPSEPDPVVVARAAPLWSAHGVLARVDLSCAADLRAALEEVEAQLVDLAAWHAAAEHALARVRACVVRAWEDHAPRSLDTPA